LLALCIVLTRKAPCPCIAAPGVVDVPKLKAFLESLTTLGDIRIIINTGVAVRASQARRRHVLVVRAWRRDQDSTRRAKQRRVPNAGARVGDHL
jgi:hypothetical protein